MHETKHHDRTPDAVEESGEVVESPKVGLKGAYQTLKESFVSWKGHWKVFTGIQVIWAAVFLAIMIVTIIAVGIAAALSGSFENIATPAELGAALMGNPLLIGALILIGLIAAALILITSTWVSLATVRAWQWVRKEEHFNMSVRNAYSSTWSLVPRYIWVTIIAGALLGLGFFGFVIPGVLLALAFVLLPAVVLTEGLAGRHAIMRTTRLAHPYLLSIFWRMLVACVLIYVPGEIVAWILNEISDGFGDAINQMYSLVVSPILTGVLYATYLEIKDVERKAPHTSWFSLERLALIGAVLASIVVLFVIVFGRG